MKQIEDGTVRKLIGTLDHFRRCLWEGGIVSPSTTSVQMVAVKASRHTIRQKGVENIDALIAELENADPVPDATQRIPEIDYVAGVVGMLKPDVPGKALIEGLEGQILSPKRDAAEFSADFYILLLRQIVETAAAMERDNAYQDECAKLLKAGVDLEDWGEKNIPLIDRINASARHDRKRLANYVDHDVAYTILTGCTANLTNIKSDEPAQGQGNFTIAEQHRKSDEFDKQTIQAHEGMSAYLQNAPGDKQSTKPIPMEIATEAIQTLAFQIAMSLGACPHCKESIKWVGPDLGHQYAECIASSGVAVKPFESGGESYVIRVSVERRSE